MAGPPRLDLTIKTLHDTMHDWVTSVFSVDLYTYRTVNTTPRIQSNVTGGAVYPFGRAEDSDNWDIENSVPGQFHKVGFSQRWSGSESSDIL